MKQNLSELEILIRARYPLIYVISWEEGRVIQELNIIATNLNKKIYEWSINHGMSRLRISIDMAEKDEKKTTKDPIIALREIANSTEPSLYILKDFHRFMKDSAVIRGLRDLAIQLRQTYISLIIISPLLELPDELEKDITVVDYPLPDKKTIERLLLQINEDLKDNPRFKIELSESIKERLIDAAIGLTLNEAENVFAKTLVLTGNLTEKEIPLVYSEKKQIIRKTGILEYIEPKEKMDEVGGVDNLKVWLNKRRRAFGEQARQFGLPVPKGVLFLGIQGCGKSLCAKAVANLWQLPLLRLDMGQLFSSYVGESEATVRRAIQIAESLSPVILWIDELDKGFAGLQSSHSSDAGTTSRVFGTLITWLQEKTMPVFVIATANSIEPLPPELLRRGRFDEIFFVDLPSFEERKQILKIHISQRRRKPEAFDLDRLATLTEGFSGAEIEQVVISALYDAFDKSVDLNMAFLEQAIKDTYPLSLLMKEEIDARKRWSKGRTRPASSTLPTPAAKSK